MLRRGGHITPKSNLKIIWKITEIDYPIHAEFSRPTSGSEIALSSFGFGFFFVQVKVNCVARENTLGCKEEREQKNLL
jgi:hypothetical protein